MDIRCCAIFCSSFISIVVVVLLVHLLQLAGQAIQRQTHYGVEVSIDFLNQRAAEMLNAIAASFVPA